jgi:hypothetical protein
MTAALLTSRALRLAAKQRLALSSVAHVASGYASSLRPCEPCFSRPESATCSEDGL